MGKITRNELAPVLTAELDATAASITETGEKLDAAATKQTEILTGVNGVKTDTTAIKSDTTTIKSDTATIKTNTTTIKSDVSTIKSDTATIKTNTQNILAQFPISGGVDWGNKTPKTAYLRTTGITLTSILDISGQGYLTGISQIYGSTSSYSRYLELIVDGETLVSTEDPFCGYGFAGTLNSIIRFNKSLTVNHRSTTSSHSLITRVYYLLD